MKNDEDIAEYICPYRQEKMLIKLSDLICDERFNSRMKLYKFKCPICGGYHRTTEDEFEYCKTLVTKKEDSKGIKRNLRKE